MLFSTSCKQGKLQFTEDGFLQVVSLFGGQPVWREAVQSIRAIDIKIGAMASCSILIHATQDHIVTMVVQKDFDQLRQFVRAPVTQVAELVVSPPASYQQPMPMQPPQQAPQGYPQPAPMQPPPQGYQQPYYQPQPPPAYQQPYYQPPAPVAPPQMETTVKSYKTPKDYQHDLKKMQRQGWSVQGALDHHQDRSMAYKLFVPFGAFSGGTGQIVVTYQRPKK